MYYIWSLLYDIITVTLQFSHGFSSKWIGYNTNCIGAVTQSKPMGTNTNGSVTNALSRVEYSREAVTKS